MARPEQICKSPSPSDSGRRVEGDSGPALAWIKAAECRHITVCAHKHQLMKQREGLSQLAALRQLRVEGGRRQGVWAGVSSAPLDPSESEAVFTPQSELPASLGPGWTGAKTRVY